MIVHVDPVALSAASGSKRRAMIEHLARCARCRNRAAAHDPAILFSLLALSPIPDDVLSGVSTEVARRAGRDRLPLGGLVGSAPWPRRAAVAAVLLLTLVSGYTTLRERPVAPPEIFRSQPRADVDVAAENGVSQVIDLTVGDTQIVMVYNGDLKL